ncbi:hypothetical protein O181_106518 [Austropuccinia psidii MF-1]|uniref:Uncharacterized protein n=1 Tax=Austropuccinia psidii MF-1 TaxID=1389203 RepID=A0A9Q3JQV8_9BASI|nr:hypothetical protein [Austropuccinia psidii MF-1]
MRDQKQLDFEELWSYLSSLTTKRDQLAAGYSAALGLGSHPKKKLIESFSRANDYDSTREGKIHKLDPKTKDLEEVVTAARILGDYRNESKPYW